MHVYSSPLYLPHLRSYMLMRAMKPKLQHLFAEQNTNVKANGPIFYSCVLHSGDACSKGLIKCEKFRCNRRVANDSNDPLNSIKNGKRRQKSKMRKFNIFVETSEERSFSNDFRHLFGISPGTRARVQESV